jgi:acyl-CoA hydrolase
MSGGGRQAAKRSFATSLAKSACEMGIFRVIIEFNAIAMRQRSLHRLGLGRDIIGLMKAESMGNAQTAHDSQAEGRTVDETRVVMSRIMQPPDANSWGNVHGGAIMRLVDEAGGAVAIRHSRRQAVTVAIDRMVFKHPVYIGDLLTIRACLNYSGHTSMEVQAEIEAENMRTGEVRSSGTCYLVYVALDDQGRPAPVPPLLVRTDEERARWRAAEERRAARTTQAIHEEGAPT